jgi:hypothetical protein
MTQREPNCAHAGGVSLFEREGFVIVGRPSEKNVVMQREVSFMANRRSSSERHERRCALCHRSILDDEKAARHHPKLKSEGGIETVEVHANCHVVHHSVRNHGRDVD